MLCTFIGSFRLSEALFFAGLIFFTVKLLFVIPASNINISAATSGCVTPIGLGWFIFFVLSVRVIVWIRCQAVSSYFTGRWVFARKRYQINFFFFFFLWHELKNFVNEFIEIRQLVHVCVCILFDFVTQALELEAQGYQRLQQQKEAQNVKFKMCLNLNGNRNGKPEITRWKVEVITHKDDLVCI